MDYFVKCNKLTNYTTNSIKPGSFQEAVNSSSSQEAPYILRNQKSHHLMQKARPLSLS